MDRGLLRSRSVGRVREIDRFFISDSSDLSSSCIAVAISCSNLPNPANGRVTLSGIAVASVATYACNADFLLVGVEARVCQADGAWSATAPACQSETCTILYH